MLYPYNRLLLRSISKLTALEKVDELRMNLCATTSMLRPHPLLPKTLALSIVKGNNNQQTTKNQQPKTKNQKPTTKNQKPPLPILKPPFICYIKSSSNSLR